INRSNVKNLHVAFAVQLGGTEPGGDKKYAREQDTPLVEDGMLYMTDGWSEVYKIDVRDGKKGRILWKMDPTVDRSTVWLPTNRGVALYGNQVISLTTDGRVISTDKETGKVLWDKLVRVADVDNFTGAPLLVKDMIILPSSGGDIGARSWIGAVDADNGKIVWYFQYTPNDAYDYDEVGSQMIYDITINGEPRKVLGHFGRNGFYYTLDRTNGSFISAAQYVKNLNWTKGIDPKTGKPV